VHIEVDDHIEDTALVLPAVLEALPEGFSAWASSGSIIVYEGDVEVANVPVRGLDPDEAVSEVRTALKGVI